MQTLLSYGHCEDIYSSSEVMQTLLSYGHCEDIYSSSEVMQTLLSFGDPPSCLKCKDKNDIISFQ